MDTAMEVEKKKVWRGQRDKGTEGKVGLYDARTLHF